MALYLALVCWYGGGALVARWMRSRGHHPSIWVFAGALLGAASVVPAVAVRRAVRLRPSASLGPSARGGWSGSGLTVALVVGPDASVVDACRSVTRLGAAVELVDVAWWVDEDARWYSGDELDELILLVDIAAHEGLPVRSVTVVSESSFRGRPVEDAYDVAVITAGVGAHRSDSERTTDLDRWRRRIGADRAVPVV
jgi:hypothetical protein